MKNENHVGYKYFISAALFPNGRAAQAFYKALSGEYQPVMCDYIVDELHRKFREKFPEKLTELEARRFCSMHSSIFTWFLPRIAKQERKA